MPFTQRFWELAIQLGESNGGSGHIGMITANSFMKREFGKKLIEELFPKIDLTHVIDTSGAYIPGHTTATVILFGRNQRPVGDSVRGVLGIKGEPNTPEEPSQGLVWQSIIKQIDRAGSQDGYSSTADIPRTTLNSHPWSIGGGGAAELKELLDETSQLTLGELSDSIGITSVTGEDDLYVFPAPQDARRLGVRHTCSLVLGEMIRDFTMATPVTALWPYDVRFNLCAESDVPDLLRVLWPCRVSISQRRRFGTPMLLKGAKWYEWQELYDDKFNTPVSITFAFVATHNHFVLDRGGKVFKQSAPIIKLPADSTEDDHLALLGLLNSATACFWMKQVMNCKGLGGQGGGIKPEHWSRAYEFASTQMERFPIPEYHRSLIQLAKEVDNLAQAAGALLPDAIVQLGTHDLGNRLVAARQQFEATRRRMVALQEEQDWKVYSLFGLCRDTTSIVPTNDELYPEDRPVERLLKSRLSHGDKSIFYEVHAYRGTGARNGPPAKNMESIIQERLTIIEKNAEIRMLEQLDYKRRWQTDPWEEQEQRALKNWLLDRLEDKRYWPRIELQSTAQLADRASADAEFMQVAALYRGRPDFDLAALISDLVEGGSVPFLPILRYKASGLRKRDLWERTWDLQRQEDAGKDVGEIPVPPKYTTADFLKTDFWRLRGKLDVPKERWISYPHCQTVSDPTLVVGWAGWNYLEQATALVTYYDARKREGWDAKRLTPLLVGLQQLLPWIHQWHPTLDKEFGETAGKSYQTMLEHDAHELGLTLEDIRTWQPPEMKTTRRRTRK